MVTGVAVVQAGRGSAPPRLECTGAIAAERFVSWAHAAQATYRPTFAVVEDWEYQGPRRARGVAHQARAAGYVAGILAALDVPVVLVTRRQVFQALKIQQSRGARGRFRAGASRGKQSVADRVRVLAPPVNSAMGEIPRTEHEWDAVAIALAGWGQWHGRPA